ncbi:MAG: hypothetical protein N2050_10870 [Flavobacteriales bacterium]|nr:hypothetical protein [Flavobacteriales bacterium]MCX7651034.1 hypothetical protein [Flavobacteriales bacterium]MDW8431844.1 hypothetical protein [Flavobacteriales bacterium]
MSRKPGSYYLDISGHSIKPQTDLFEFSADFLESLSLDPSAHIQSAAAQTVLTRHPSFLELQVDVKVQGEMACSRCLKMLPLAEEKNDLYIVKFWSDAPPSDDDPNLLWLHKGEVSMDLTPVFSDLLMQVLPQRFTCTEEMVPKPCDLQVLEKLKDISIGN